MFVCMIIILVLETIDAFVLAGLSASLTTKIREAVFNKTVDFSLEEVGKFTTSSLINRCTFDTMQVQSFIKDVPYTLFSAPLLGVYAVIKLAGLNLTWAGITIFSVAATILSAIILLTITVPKTNQVHKLIDVSNRLSLEHLSGLRMLHAYNAYDYQRQKFSSRPQHLHQRQDSPNDSSLHSFSERRRIRDIHDRNALEAETRIGFSMVLTSLVFRGSYHIFGDIDDENKRIEIYPKYDRPVYCLPVIYTASETFDKGLTEIINLQETETLIEGITVLAEEPKKNTETNIP